MAISKHKMKLALAFALLLLQPVFGLYIYVTDGQQKCFIEEVPAETLIVGTYKNPDFVPYGRPDFNGVGLKLNVQDPANNMVLTKALDVEGKFAFTSAAGGEYQLCFSTNSSRWFGQPKKFRFDIKLDVGETGIDYQEVAKREHLSDLEVEIRKLNDKVKDIIREQQYQRGRETSFRNTSESTNDRVKWWSIFQTVVMVTAGVWQIWHIKRFLKNKKIV